MNDDELKMQANGRDINTRRDRVCSHDVVL